MKNKINIPDIPGFETTIEPIPDGVDPIEYFRQQIDNCPECRAARERGEEPVIHSGEELTARARRPKLFPRRPRWRTMKKSL